MTGFGRGTAATDAFVANVELSAVNRKQAEVVVQAPREVLVLEPRIRRVVLGRIDRGRVQVMVRLDRPAGAPVPVRVDLRLARALDDAFVGIAAELGRPLAPVATDFLRQPGIIDLEEADVDPEAAWRAVEPALAAALEALVAMRAAEWADLRDDMSARLGVLERVAADVAGLAPRVPVRQRELLLGRLREAGLELDPSDERVVREVAIFADRCDITEELTRLAAHFGRFRDYLGSGGAAGRALDFLCQEIHREWNTLGSKANDAEIAQRVVEAKAELERVREQVQNIE